MTAPPSPSQSRLHLADASVLLVESSHQGMGILTQIFRGFGVSESIRARDAEQALEAVRAKPLDLIVAETSLPGEMDGYDFVRELRRLRNNPNCFVPVILVTGHTQVSKIKKARDCGANFIVAKPLTPKVLLDRILWVSREARQFVEAGQYLGPDRRYKAAQPPAKVGDRRQITDSEGSERVAS